jgi:hypothetical protein
MATLIPSLGSARFDSRGELRLAERLKDFLEENSYIWHNLPMGPRGRHPDFVIVHPAKGLLVLEVKDWRMDTIASATKSDVELVTAKCGHHRFDEFEGLVALKKVGQTEFGTSVLNPWYQDDALPTFCARVLEAWQTGQHE